MLTDPPRRQPWPAIALALIACARRPPPVPEGLAAQGVHRITVDTGDAHGLSGLALAPDGALWTVAERSAAAFRVELDTSRAPPAVRAIARWPVVGLPAGEELEALAALPDGTMLAGTEGSAQGVVHAYRLAPADGRLEVRGGPIALAADVLGVDAGANHGAEGACAIAGTIVLAIEATGRDAGGRWAPVALVADRPDGAAPTIARVRLTTDTGKLSGLDCWRDGERLRVIAIERHFAVTRVLGFELPVSAATAEAPPAPTLTPTVLIDLAPVLHGSLNLEGLVRLPDGHLVAVVDNQYGRLTGPDELLWLAAVPAW